MHRINKSLAQEGQPVMVYQELSDEDRGILCAEQSVLRRGYAVSADAGEYTVRFTDGLDPHVGDVGPVGGGSSSVVMGTSEVPMCRKSHPSTSWVLVLCMNHPCTSQPRRKTTLWNDLLLVP